MPRKIWIGGNWKCVYILINSFILHYSNILYRMEQLNQLQHFVKHLMMLVQFQVMFVLYIFIYLEVVIAPTNLHVHLVKDLLRKDITLAVQNVWKENVFFVFIYQKQGAFTGEITAPLVKDIGIPAVILGHSERRHTVAAESNELIAEKTVTCLANGLDVILCIGELLEEREANKTFDVIDAQLDAVIKAVKPEDWAKIVIAYEPVWAIGTGKTASPEQAQEVHEHIRKHMATKVNDKVAEAVQIVYGGSVNTKNCDNLIAKPDIDGFLVGGASLKPDFFNIINCKH